MMSNVQLELIEETPDEVKAKRLPVPVTYHLLCMVPEVDEAYESGIIKADQAMHFEELLRPVLFVMAMGPDAYQDKTRFPSGPSCKVGDFIICRPNSGTRLNIDGVEMRIINDDSVEAVIEDIRGIRRV